MITIPSVFGALALAAACLAVADRRRRLARARADLAEVRGRLARIRDQQRAWITEDVADMTHADITWQLIGICQASAATERGSVQP